MFTICTKCGGPLEKPKRVKGKYGGNSCNKCQREAIRKRALARFYKMRQPTKKEIAEFLRESNAIEQVYDDDSLEQAHLAWEYLMMQDTLTPDVVKNTHAILMKNQDLLESEKGQFRTCAVYIGGREGMPWTLLEGAISNWCNENLGRKTDKELHVMYEAIHPFIDGNGRTGRLFMNWLRLKRKMPILIIHEGEEQWDYYQWFR